MSREAICGGWGRDDLADAGDRARRERAGYKKSARRAPEVPLPPDIHANRFGVPTPYGCDPLAGASGLIRRGVKRSLDK